MSDETQHPMNREYLADLAKTISERLPDNHGFVLLVTPTDTPEPFVHYTASVERKSAIQILRSILFHWGEGENWMRHIR